MSEPIVRRIRVTLLAATGVLALAVPTATAAGAHPAVAGRATACAGKADPALRAHTGRADVIVIGRSSRAAGHAVTASGGAVVSAEPVVDGVRASVPAARIARLACASGVLSVTPNRAVRFQNNDTATAGASASEFVQATGARQAWAAGDRGDVGVAVIDTGISPMT